MKNLADRVYPLKYEVWMNDINGDRRLASFRYEFLAEEFIELQYKRHKPATFYIINIQEEQEN